jgi:hypothetical protein
MPGLVPGIHEAARLHLAAQRRETQMSILTVNLLFSTVVFAIAAKLYLLPMLPRLEPRSVVIPILLLHAMRHLGLMFSLRERYFRACPSDLRSRLRTVTCSPPSWR